ncbi:hypothetical protein [Mucilaginibacter sp. SP1R1]|uniref:hypothetical protein n=1 Tax=Mucilaginibacter sp. SP1R1 TaxID=2723091 RepID=UPI00160BB4DD|nr:hypothetical protein [Mucilaginibacter sp. SP1R1]MBB6150071.1 ABC-type dipeptide/oligopeptide/nickel transport system permease subunit [Mucilaginibacter sp. SP1R1]
MATPELLLLLIPVIYLIGAVVLIFVTRLIFSIPTFLRYQKAQTKLLSEIALKNGVEVDRITEILNGINK